MCVRVFRLHDSNILFPKIIFFNVCVFCLTGFLTKRKPSVFSCFNGVLCFCYLFLSLFSFLYSLAASFSMKFPLKKPINLKNSLHVVFLTSVTCHHFAFQMLSPAEPQLSFNQNHAVAATATATRGALQLGRRHCEVIGWCAPSSVTFIITSP